MRTEGAAIEHESGEIRALAERLDYITDRQLQELADVKDTTTEAWRKRGIGPAYVRLGRNVFYPTAAVVEFLNGRIKRNAGATRSAL